MKILLINSPIRLEARPNCIPTGLAIIAACLRSSGHSVEIYDCNALRPTESQITDKLTHSIYDIIGVSGLITTYKFQKWLLKRARLIHPQAILVAGGGLASTCFDLLLSETDVDVCVIGEGEYAMINICRGEYDTVMNLPVVPDLDRLPFPAWDLLPMDIYLKNPIWGDSAGNSSQLPGLRITRSMNIITSRGCPFACNYCFHLFGRGSYRQRSVDSVCDEIATLISTYGVDFIGFVDDNMMTSKTWMIDFCNALNDRRINIKWGCHGRVTSADPVVLESMAAAGCVWIGYGVESGSQKILDAMGKRQTVLQAKAAVINTRKAGIFPNTTFIFGYPGETAETVQETIEFKRDLGISCGSFFATPYLGTPLYDQTRHLLPDGYVQRLGNATDFVVNLTGFSDSEFFEQKRRYDGVGN